MPGTQDAADQIIQEHLNQAVDAELLGDHPKAMAQLGEGSHTVQDPGAHYDQGAGWLSHTLGVITFGVFSPDNPNRHKNEYAKSISRTEAYFQSFRNRTGSGGCR